MIDTAALTRMVEMSMDADWELMPPPQFLEVDAVVHDHVRRGWRCGNAFVFVDCTHPMQNMAVNVERVTAFRAREPIAIIYNPQQQCYSPGMGSTIDGIVASIFG